MEKDEFLNNGVVLATGQC